MEDLYSTRQIASICKQTLRSVNKLLKEGTLPSEHVNDRVYVTRSSLRLYMISAGVDLSRLPQAAVEAAAERAAANKPQAANPTTTAMTKHVAGLESYVRELRTKLFYRDLYRVADRLRSSAMECDKIEAENQVMKRRWDAETERHLAALSGMK